MLQFLLLVLFLCLPDVFGAVLTSTRIVYFPFTHFNVRPADQNGELFYIGEENGVTTYLFTEPAVPGVTATFIEGENVAVIIASNNPSFVGSYSCDVQVTQAVCLLVNSDPQNGAVVSELTTDTPIDSLAVLVVGLPGETPQPTPSTPAPSTPSPTASPRPSSAPPANQNPPPSTPKDSTPILPSQTFSQPSPSSQPSQPSQPSQASQPSQPSQPSGPSGPSQTNDSPPVKTSGKDTPSQSSQSGLLPTTSFPLSGQGNDQNLLPGSGSAKMGPTITLGVSILLNSVLLYVSLLW